MLERVGNIIYYVSMALAIILTFVTFVFSYGSIGIFAAMGVIFSFMVALAFIESLIKYVIVGDWEFPPKGKEK